MSGWTDERLAEAVRLRDEDGLSYGQIADALNDPSLTRNAVLGKLKRMDAAAEKSGPNAVPPDKLIAERKRQLRVRGHGNRVSRGNDRTPSGIAPSKAAAGLVSRPVEPKTIQPVAEPTGATNVSLLDLPFFGACKYPVGPATGRDQMFCGAKVTTSDARYCDHHRLIAYQPPQARRKSPPAYTPKPTFEEA